MSSTSFPHFVRSYWWEISKVKMDWEELKKFLMIFRKKRDFYPQVKMRSSFIKKQWFLKTIFLNGISSFYFAHISFVEAVQPWISAPSSRVSSKTWQIEMLDLKNKLSDILYFLFVFNPWFFILSFVNWKELPVIYLSQSHRNKKAPVLGVSFY